MYIKYLVSETLVLVGELSTMASHATVRALVFLVYAVTTVRPQLRATTFCNPGSGVLQYQDSSPDDCQHCRKGSWAQGGVANGRCMKCRAGTTTDKTQSTSAEQCRSCTGNTWAKEKGSRWCDECRPTYYVSANHTQCTPCEFGMVLVNNVPNAAGVQYWCNCEFGSYWENGIMYCDAVSTTSAEPPTTEPPTTEPHTTEPPVVGGSVPTTPTEQPQTTPAPAGETSLPLENIYRIGYRSGSATQTHPRILHLCVPIIVALIRCVV